MWFMQCGRVWHHRAHPPVGPHCTAGALHTPMGSDHGSPVVLRLCSPACWSQPRLTLSTYAHEQVFQTAHLVPWMLVFGSDGKLYVSADLQYSAASSYGNPDEYGQTGRILQIHVHPDGKAMVLIRQRLWAASSHRSISHTRLVCICAAGTYLPLYVCWRHGVSTCWHRYNV